MLGQTKTRLKKFALGTIAVVVLFTALVPAIASADNAEDQPQINNYDSLYFASGTIKGQVLDHQLYYYLLGCFNTSGDEKVSPDEVKSLNWLKGDSKSVVRGSMYEYSAVSCDNRDGKWLKEALGRFFDISDPIALFCSFTFTQSEYYGGLGDDDASTSAEACESGIRDDQWGLLTKSRSERMAAVKARLGSTSKGIKANDPLTGAQEYIRYYESLMNGCSIKLIQSTAANGSKNDDQVIVPLVAQDGKITYYKGESTLDLDGIPRPFVATSTGGQKELTCRQMEAALPGYADAYSKYLKEGGSEDEDASDGIVEVGDGEEGISADNSCGGIKQVLTDPLKWLSCPMVAGFSKAAQVLDNAIMDMLCTDESQIFGSASTCTNTLTGSDTSSGYKMAWNVFRILALGLLAIAALIMILSQTLGMEIVDAYTIKKVLPRLLIAAIAISISWQLMQFFVSLTNVLGLGIRGLIYAPFNSAGIDQSVLGGGGEAILTLTTLGGLAVLGPLGILSFMATGMLAILIGFLVLVLRNLLLVVLIIAAPVAIAAFILPNTKKAWDIWWDGFSKVLLMFPIIAAFIAVGHVFAAVATEQAKNMSGINATISSVIGFIAYFAPYFLIPLTLRFAGGVMSTLGGFANNSSRGGFDRLKKYRQNRAEHNVSAMAHGNRWRNNSALTRGLNRTTRTVASLPSAGINPMAMRSRYTAAETQHTFDEAEELRTKNADFMSGMQDDRVLRAILRGGHQGRAGVRRELQAQGIRGAELDTTTGIAERMLSSGSHESVRVAAAIQQSTTGTGYADAGEMLDTIADASGGNRALGGKMLGAMRGGAERSGRHDLGSAGFGMMAGQLGRVYDNGPGSADVRAIQRDAFQSVDVTSLARGRGESVRNLSEAVSEHVNSMAPTDERARYLAQLQNFVDNARDYGSLARSHEAHTHGADRLADVPRVTAENNAEHTAHRTQRGFDPNNPNNRTPPADE